MLFGSIKERLSSLLPLIQMHTTIAYAIRQHTKKAHPSAPQTADKALVIWLGLFHNGAC